MNLQAINYVAELLGAAQVRPPSSQGWVHITCPLASFEHQNGTDSDASFGIRVCDDGESPMHCFSCSFSGTLTNVIQTLKFRKCDFDWKALQTVAQTEYDEATLPSLPEVDMGPTGPLAYPETWLESFPSALSSGLAMAYLATRKGGPVPHSVAQMLDLRWDGMRARVGFPIRGADHRLYGLHGRAVKATEELRYLAYPNPKAPPNALTKINPQVWLGEHEVDWDKPVAVAESVFDLARVKQVYRNVISPLKAGLNAEMLARINPAFEIVTLFDPDKAGATARKKINDWAKYDKGKKRLIRHASVLDVLEPAEGEKLPDGGDLQVELMADLMSQYVELDEILLV